MKNVITVFIKKTISYVATIFFFTIIASLSLAGNVQGEETDNADDENNKHFTDTVTSGVYRVIRTYSSETNYYGGTRSGIEEELVLDLILMH